MAIPVKGEAYTFFVSLSNTALPNEFQANPTLAAGDFQISKDGGAFANLATLPVVTPALSISVLVSLSAAEMNASKINIKMIDVSGAEWEDAVATLDVPDANTETLFDVVEGDHVENKTSMVINQKGTSTAIVSKTVVGSLLPENITISTTEP